MAVTTSLANGALTITGDDAADDIAIVGTGNPGELVITGRNGTAVDGVADASVTIGGVTARLSINSAGGNDVISLDNVDTAGTIQIHTDHGDDRVTLGAWGVVLSKQSIGVSTGNGNDQVHELNYAVAGASNHIGLGDGDDVAKVIGASTTRSEVGYNGGSGNDSILVIGVTAKGGLFLNGETGIDSLALLYSAAHRIQVDCDPLHRGDQTLPNGGTIYVDTVYSQTFLFVSTYSRSALVIDGSVSVFRCFTTRMEINVGAGNNRVHVYGNAVNGPSYSFFEGVFSAGLSIYLQRPLTGAPFSNRNVVEVTYNVSPILSVSLGDGNDSLALVGNLITSATYLDGYGGVNRLFELGNLFGTYNRRNFLP